MTAIMAHMIPYFPNYETSLRAAQALKDGGVRYLEIQFPFSDPTADGPTIEAACTRALQEGFTVDLGFEFVKNLVADGGEDSPGVFIMTYASLVMARGVGQFCKDAARAGALGLIIPDLPLDSDEGLLEAAGRFGLTVIPVIVPTTTEKRLAMVEAVGPDFLYCALRTGITGTLTTLGEENLRFLDRAGKTGAKILAGFGIQTPEQVTALSPHVHGAIVGSALVRIIESATGPEDCYSKVVAFTRELTQA